MIFNRARFLFSVVGSMAALVIADTAMAGGVVGPAEKDTIGVFVTSTRTFFLRNANSSGSTAIKVSFGPAGAKPVPGNYDASPTNATDTIGVYDPATSRFYLNNANTPGAVSSFRFGSAPAPSTRTALVGNWDGVSGDTVALYDSVSGKFLLRNSNTSGSGDKVAFGPKNALTPLIPLRGNWSGGDTIDGIGLYDPATGTFFLRDSPTSGNADFRFTFGAGGQGLIPVVGNWDDNDTDTVGLFNPTTQKFFIRNSNTPGNATTTFSYGPSGVVPVSGNWDGN